MIRINLIRSLKGETTESMGYIPYLALDNFVIVRKRGGSLAWTITILMDAN